MVQKIFSNDFSLDETLSRFDQRFNEITCAMDADDQIWINSARELGVALIHTMFYLKEDDRLKIRTLDVDPDTNDSLFEKFLSLGFNKITGIYIKLLRDRLDDLQLNYENPSIREEKLKKTVELLTDYLKTRDFEIIGGNIRNINSGGKKLFNNDASLLQRIIAPESKQTTKDEISHNE